MPVACEDSSPQALRDGGVAISSRHASSFPEADCAGVSRVLEILRLDDPARSRRLLDERHGNRHPALLALHPGRPAVRGDVVNDGVDRMAPIPPSRHVSLGVLLDRKLRHELQGVERS